MTPDEPVGVGVGDLVFPCSQTHLVKSYIFTATRLFLANRLLFAAMIVQKRTLADEQNTDNNNEPATVSAGKG